MFDSISSGYLHFLLVARAFYPRKKNASLDCRRHSSISNIAGFYVIVIESKILGGLVGHVGLAPCRLDLFERRAHCVSFGNLADAESSTPLAAIYPGGLGSVAGS
jgi:hypothetical protein